MIWSSDTYFGAHCCVTHPASAVRRDASRSRVSLKPDPLSPRRQQSPSPLPKRVNQPKTMPRANSPQSESDSEPISSKKQKKREESPADDPMDEDEAEEEYEIEAILNSSKDIFKDVSSIWRSWFRGINLNVLTDRNGVLREVEGLP